MWGKKQSKKILFVEDNTINHPLFRDTFEASGFRVSILQRANGGFVDEVIGFKPDIISMDLMIEMSGVDDSVDGLQAIKILKSDSRTKDIPVIILSNFFEDNKVMQAKELGAVDFISLQGQSIKEIPNIFKQYLDNPKKFLPTHPQFRT